MIIDKYFNTLTALQKSQFEALIPLYKSWNEKINIVSRKDIENLYTHHILHSLAIAKVIDFVSGTVILDVGTGGGFPGIPLAIMYPYCTFYLADSIGKKIVVVKSVAEQLGLQNVRAEQIRAEQLTEKYHFVVTRGVASLKELIKWTGKNIIKKSDNTLAGGLLALKGGDSLIQEIGELHLHVKSTLISDFFEEEYFVEKKVVYVKV
ncbi:MAG: 16S rRNA (guanine(527)-N(7))-methyltransferase RsmG [Cytophagales bacterium]|nr:16S rRNA (guanine(527)-N(7))-methyltransferase RsmG [Cytophagales bacterium]